MLTTLLLQGEADWLKLVFQYLGPYSLVIVVLFMLFRMGLIGKPDFSAVQNEIKETRELVQKVTDSLLKTIHDTNESRSSDVNRMTESIGKLSEALNAWTKAQRK